MATVEGLFNFDEKLLARDVAGKREDYMFGNNMPKGYGAVGMGLNKMLRGLFNNDDHILKEKALAEEALQMTQQQLGGDMTDPSKMYGILMKNLTELGASPDSITKVADRKTEADSTAAASSLATSQQEFNNILALNEVTRNQEKDQETRDKNATKGIETIEKQLAKRLEVEPDYFKNMAKGLLNDPSWDLRADFNGDTTGKALEQLTGMFVRAKGPNGKALFNGLIEAETEAKNILKNSKPTATHFWGADTLGPDMYADAANLIKERGGAKPTATAKTQEKPDPVGPTGTTFVETLPDGRDVFMYEDGREVVTKGTE